MNQADKLLSDITAFTKYAKFLPHLSRRETLEETINRCMNMHLENFPKLSGDIIKAFHKVHQLKILPSMRSMQFAGNAVLKNPIRQYNCSYAPIEDPKVFSELMFILLSGTGTGYSVQKRHVNKLPKIQKPRESGIYVIHDSIEGWADALNVLLEAYFFGKMRPEFDFSKIRPKGSYLITTGAYAPGPEPLKASLKLIEELVSNANGRKLKPIECHDVMCIASDCVYSGGIRRAACIVGFDIDDVEMLKCKYGSWWEKYPYRARANNSVILDRSTTTYEEFSNIFNICKESGSGEPGFSWTNNKDWFFNPCHELALRPYQFCNLTTINQSNIEDKKDFMSRIYSTSLIGTIQAAYTDFHYLRPIWKETTELDALLGISFTGIADKNSMITDELLKEGAEYTIEVNKKYSKKLGINSAARLTCIKPEGTASCILASSSGIHARHARYYIRRQRYQKSEPFIQYLLNNIPELVEQDILKPDGVIITIPQKSPEGSIIRHNETAESLFFRAIKYNKNWINYGHITGDNKNNVSVTISVKDNEWESLKELMWEHREYYSGISLLPFDNGSYQQAPFTDSTKEEYEYLLSFAKDIDLTKVKEYNDNTARMENLACFGGSCELI